MYLKVSSLRRKKQTLSSMSLVKFRKFCWTIPIETGLPFAFTGNKFEFRAVGSKSNCAKSITVLNAAVAQQLEKFGNEVEDLIEKKDMKKDDAIFNVLRDNLKGIKNILFEGDGYSDSWINEAQKRGLSHNQNTPEALTAYISKKYFTF